MSKTRTWKLTPSKRREGWHALIGPLNEDFLTDFKAAVPYEYRGWVGTLRAWLVHGDFIDDVQRIIAAHTITTAGPTPAPAPLTARDLPTLAATFGELARADQFEDIRAGVMAGAEAVSGSIGLAPDLVAARKVDDAGKRYLLVCALLEIG